MRHAACGCLSTLSLLACLSAVRCADTTELDQYEDKCVIQAAERLLKAGKNDRAHWLKELEAAYPGKVANALTEEEYATWFDLLAGKNDDWRRDDAPNPQITELFDRVVKRLELGPVPNIKRDEFKKYARRLREQNPSAENEPGPNDDADKAFRALDRNGDGELDRDELTLGLRDEKVRVDADGNGRISKEEYREYFRRKVARKSESLAVKAAEGDGKTTGKNGKPGTGLPDWFTTLDIDKDGQISLFEWRKGGKPTALFQEMDLNGDGLITKDEYLRYIRLKAIDDAQKKREEERPEE